MATIPVSRQIRSGGAVNLSEAVAKLCDKGVPEVEVRQAIGSLPIEVAPFDEQLAYEAGLLRATTRASGLSLGDRACSALARKLDLPALTTDRSWAGLSGEVTVTLVR